MSQGRHLTKECSGGRDARDEHCKLFIHSAPPSLRCRSGASRRDMLVYAAVLLSSASLTPPPARDKAATARWMAHTLDWGVLSTVSTRTEGTTVGDPFGNPYSFADIDGVPYFYTSMLDSSMKDLAHNGGNISGRVSLALSEATLPADKASKACTIQPSTLGDPENPPCARLVLTGTLAAVDKAAPDYGVAKQALFTKHPSFSKYPPTHYFFVAKLAIDGIWLIDFYGGAAIVSPDDYFGSKAAATVNAAGATNLAAAIDERMGPPPGPKSSALCPVTGDAINITDATPSVEFTHGQKLYFATSAAAAAYRSSPPDYWLGPHDTPLPGMDGMRGLPDLRGESLTCPRSGEKLKISMQSIRVDHKHGQAVYFCCHGCVTAFWRDPQALFAPTI